MDKPKGMLMTGAIGSIFFAVAWAIFISMGAAILSLAMGGGMLTPGEGDANLFGGLTLLALVLILAAGFLQGIGFFGLGKMYGGVFSVAGLLTILASVALIAVVVAAFGQMLELLQYGMLGLFGAMILGALFGGIGFLGAKGKAASGGGGLMAAGVLLLVGALAFIVLIVLGMARINVGLTVAEILGYVAIGGLLLGHIAATIAFFGQRS
jgi:hypothetical protein